jgi:hypothetical protein
LLAFGGTTAKGSIAVGAPRVNGLGVNEITNLYVSLEGDGVAVIDAATSAVVRVPVNRPGRLAVNSSTNRIGAIAISTTVTMPTLYGLTIKSPSFCNAQKEREGLTAGENGLLRDRSRWQAG